MAIKSALENYLTESVNYIVRAEKVKVMVRLGFEKPLVIFMILIYLTVEPEELGVLKP